MKEFTFKITYNDGEEVLFSVNAENEKEAFEQVEVKKIELLEV